ncbi:GNAT family N-acetyltransferase [Arthrobacter sp.]|uniref:GNAT family N-acetyltransferase n=1 Tax=Arthrobacter sp. TaxID=1667 RepID=UPI003A9230ED
MPAQLHPGDLGWAWQLGAAALADRVRLWSEDNTILAVGFLDGPRLLRLAIAPGAGSDRELAERMAADLGDPRHGVLPAGPASVENHAGPALRRQLHQDGWTDGLRGGVPREGWGEGDLWTPLRRDLSASVPDPGVRIEVVGTSRMAERVAVQRAAFEDSHFSGERWQLMARGPAYASARCLLAYDDQGTAVAMVTVWSAGPGRPGLLEPMGVHRDHRGRGHGRAICRAAAATLRELGASSAMVATPTANAAGVATYVAAGYQRLPQVSDLVRAG